MPHKHIVIVAGEASGDQHAAHLVQQLRQHDPTLQYSGIGGIEMQNAGVDLIYNLAQYGVTGFIEVLHHSKAIYKAFNLIKRHLIAHKPDLLILVDYPGFNLRLAKFAKKMGIKTLYYISPQIWAWKAKRLHTIKRTIDMMAVILPFEKPLYQAAQVPVRFVGHPLAKKVKLTLSQEATRTTFGLSPHSHIIGVLPGSRRMEIKRLLPIMLQACQLIAEVHPHVEFVLPLASSLDPQILTPYLSRYNLKLTVTQQQFYDVVNCCHSLMVASGTASLEAALLTKPMVIVYQTSLLSYAIATQLIKVKYLGLCNLLAGGMIVPELLQYDLTPEHLYQQITAYLTEPVLYRNTVTKLQNIYSLLTSQNADCELFELVMQLYS